MRQGNPLVAVLFGLSFAGCTTQAARDITEADRQAFSDIRMGSRGHGRVWEYLRSIQPFSHAVSASPLVTPTAGATPPSDMTYGAYRLACQGVKGAGSPFTTSPLKMAARDLDDETLAMIIAEGPGTAMPAFGKTLSNGQIRQVAATIRSS